MSQEQYLREEQLEMDFNYIKDLTINMNYGDLEASQKPTRCSHYLAKNKSQKIFDRRLIAEKYDELSQFYHRKIQQNNAKDCQQPKVFKQEDSNITICKVQQQGLLNQENELILVLKFMLGKASKIVPWDALPITPQQGYAYIQKHEQRLYSLFESKLQRYMKNIIDLYTLRNTTITTLFVLLFQKYKIKFEIELIEPDFMHETFKKGMLGIEFHAVPWNPKAFRRQEIDQ